MKSILNKKTVLIISLILILTLIISTSYAFFISSDSQTNVASTACFELTFSASNTISLEHSYPISEAEASNLTPYTFTIKNICKEASSYNVTIEDLNTSDMDLGAIRYKLDNETSVILGSITPNQTKVLTTSKSSRTIASGMLLYNEEITYNIKLWIDENASVNQTAGKSFESKIIVVSSMDKNPYYTVTVNPNNGDSSYTRKIVKGRNLGNITEPTKVGYTFEGWYKDSQLTQSIDSSSSITQDENIYAKFTPNQYTITYSSASGSISPPSKVVTYDLTYGDLPNPTWSNHIFDGWYLDSNYTNKITSSTTVKILNNQTVYAKWKYPYTVTNLIQNSSYESGSANWTDFLDAEIDSSVKRSGSKSLKLKIPTSAIHNMSMQSISAPQLNHKYYGRAYYYTTVAQQRSSRFEIFYNDNIGTGLLLFTSASSNVAANTWTPCSSIQTITSSTYLNQTWVVRNFTYKPQVADFYVDDLSVIDLTAAFGAGNEPSKEWCDNNINYFDSSATVYY